MDLANVSFTERSCGLVLYGDHDFLFLSLLYQKLTSGR